MIRLICDLCGQSINGKDAQFHHITINWRDRRVGFECCESCASGEIARLEEIRETALRPDVISEPPAEMGDAV